MKLLSIEDCIDKIRAIKKSWKKSHISIIDIQQYPDLWYRIVKFKYKEKEYEYRESASEAWIS